MPYPVNRGSVGTEGREGTYRDKVASRRRGLSGVGEVAKGLLAQEGGLFWVH